MTTNKFIVKLCEMMRQYPLIINWSSDGKEIDIFDVQKFSSEVHPKFFTTSNYQSFVRQLNMYNFKKMAKRRNSVSFRHEDFRRDNPEAAKNIRRRKQKNLPQEQREQKEASSQMEELTTAHSAPITIDNEIKQTLTLLRKEVTQSGMGLLAKLEQLLQRSMSGCISSDNRLTENPSSRCELRSFVSFCKIEDHMIQKADCYASGNSEFNFQSHIFHQGAYLEQ